MAPRSADGRRLLPTRIANANANANVVYFTAAEERKMTSDPVAIREARRATFASVKEARMVPKEKAALAYTDTVRRQADPALLEWAGAGVFNARVFPLAPHALHRVVIAYDMPLTQAGGRSRVPSRPAADRPRTSSSTSRARRCRTRDWRSSKMGPVPTRISGIPIPRRSRFAGKNRFLRRSSGMTRASENHFIRSQKPDLPARASGQDSDTAVFVIDTSLSSNPDRFNIYEKLLAATLENNRATLKHFAVLFFDVSPRWYKPAFVDNTKANADALVAAMDQMLLEGATDLGAALRESASPKWLVETKSMHWDTFLLSDGAPTWGESDEHTIAQAFVAQRRGQLFGYNTGISGTDTQMLASVARESGGAIFSVRRGRRGRRRKHGTQRRAHGSFAA